MTTPRTITLRSGVTIGDDAPCFIVAEIGNNHQGSVETAKEMIARAAEAGAQGVKFQKRDMDALLTTAGRAAPYTGKNSFGPTYGEHRLALELSIDEMAELKEYSEKQGVVFFASAWDMPSLEQILDLDVELCKIASADLVNVPMLRRHAQSGVPVILSSGMSAFEDIDIAIGELSKGLDDIILLHCNSSYPCPEDQIGLPVMDVLRERYGLPIGYSGHERGLGPSVASLAFGACVVERHFTLDRTLPGTDHQVSLEPQDLANLVKMIREVEPAMRVKGKMVFPDEMTAARKLRKCIVAARDLPAGHVITEADVTTRSPKDGISPIHWDKVIGATLRTSMVYEQPMQWEHIDVQDAEQRELVAVLA